mmetsp:Transcript_55838/g.115276  ORF Transcript_55838/g.115276 Transcript_55838/m.115276 type:complete len:317 (+) Transcript_55838:868-1818(+)
MAEGVLPAHVLRGALLAAGAHSSVDPRITAGLVLGVAGIQPHHVNVDVVPKRESRNMATIQRRAHGLASTFLFVVVFVVEELLYVLAHPVGDGVRSLREDGDGRACNRPAILHVEAPNLGKVALVCAVRGQKLCHHRHRPGRVHRKVRSLPIEAGVAIAERVDVAAVLVTEPIVSLATVVVSTLCAFADVLAWHVDVARVGRVSRGHVVRLPNVHLCAAGAIVAQSNGIAEVLRMRLPVFGVGRAADKLHVVRALRVAVPGAVLGACSVVSAAFSSVSSHLEIHGPIHATLHGGRVHIQRKLSVLELEELVSVVVL